MKQINKLELGERDAIHVPVICLLAHKVLYAGEPVGIHGDYKSTCRGIEGTVDPFQESPVDSGTPVIVWLKPGSVSDVRHAWHFLNEEDPKSKKPFQPDYKRWNDYRDTIAVRLQCDPWTIDDGVSHMIQYGGSSGGPQPNLEGVDEIDWKEFWRVYNECHGTQYAWEEDPFCC